LRYHNFRSFTKHLASAAPDHLCKRYLIAVPDEYERRAAIQAILSHLPGCDRISFQGSETSCGIVADALLSPTLFSGEPIVFLDEAEKMGKKEQQALADWVASSPHFGYFLACAGSKTPLSGPFEKVGVVFDLLEEKPWEKEKRLGEQMAERASAAGKRLASDAALLLLERMGPDPAGLASEIDKLICFVGDKPLIDRSDIFRISAAAKAHTLWQEAEGIVWEGETGASDPSSFHGLIPALRSQLQTGLKLFDLVSSGRPREEWASFLPRLWPKLMEKRTAQAAKLGRRYFKTGLELLFEIELLSRSGSSSEEALLDYFKISMCHARR